MRRVRLTEGQLHNVIRESVNQILNELDWKTYYNAAHKKLTRLGWFEDPDKVDDDERNREVSPLESAAFFNLTSKYPHYMHDLDDGKALEDMCPEAQKEYAELNKELDDYYDGRYKYEKGGRGYYLDDED
jgi:hypothetical protein